MSFRTVLMIFNGVMALIMAALLKGMPLYFWPVVSSFSIFLFFPRLISAVADWMSAILPHTAWP